MVLITTNYQYNGNNYNSYADAAKDTLYSIAGRTIEASVVAKSI